MHEVTGHAVTRASVTGDAVTAVSVTEVSGSLTLACGRATHPTKTITLVFIYQGSRRPEPEGRRSEPEGRRSEPGGRKAGSGMSWTWAVYPPMALSSTLVSNLAPGRPCSRTQSCLDAPLTMLPDPDLEASLMPRLSDRRCVCWFHDSSCRPLSNTRPLHSNLRSESEGAGSFGCMQQVSGSTQLEDLAALPPGVSFFSISRTCTVQYE